MHIVLLLLPVQLIGDAVATDLLMVMEVITEDIMAEPMLVIMAIQTLILTAAIMFMAATGMV